MRTARTGGSKGFEMNSNTPSDRTLQDAWLLCKQRIAEIQRDGLDAGRYLELEHELAMALGFNPEGRRAA